MTAVEKMFADAGIGPNAVKPETIAQRLAICRACTSWTDDKRCGEYVPSCCDPEPNPSNPKSPPCPLNRW